MKRPMNNPFVIFTLVILLATSSCHRAPATATLVPTAQFTTTVIPTGTSLAPLSTLTFTPGVVRLPPTLTPTVPPARRSIISAGVGYTCALTASRGVKCWGANDYGELGNGTTIHSSTPVDVVGLESGVVSVVAGVYQTCALLDSGGVKCWGLNETGALGDGTQTNSSTPVGVAGLGSGVVSISVGGSHACAVTVTGGLQCWGAAWYGQSEEGAPDFISTPADVPGLNSGVAAVSIGYNHVCVLTTSGGVRCWGFNASGQLGGGTTMESSSTPVDVVGLGSRVAMLTTGTNHTCALMASGGVKCWGDNTWGQVGDGTTEDRYAPVDVLGLGSGVVAVTAGSGDTCALTASGGVKCWGHGYLGDGTANNSSTPVNVTGLGSGVAAIASGGGHSCALTASGEVKCWGDNSVGQLGDGLPPLCVTPVDVQGLSSGVSAISVGSGDACALTDGGKVKCWGYDFITEGITSERSSPVDMAGLDGEVKALAVGSVLYICALTGSGEVKCWDKDRSPVAVAGLGSGVKLISAGVFHDCVVMVTGGVKCWGESEYGGLGDGTTNPSSMPVDVMGLGSGVSSVTVGFSHSCALTVAGGVKCWGWNGFGQLGDGTVTDRLTPVDVLSLDSGVAAIAAGSYHTCALTTTGGVKCWGQNEEGQLGDGTPTLKPVVTPVDVVGLSTGVVMITAGENHTCALLASGRVKCWGWNYYGQLGIGTLEDRSTPVDVMGLDDGITAVASGSNFNCALTVSGGVKCWGNDHIGQMGDGRLLWSSIPVSVVGWGNDPALIPSPFESFLSAAHGR